MLYRPVLPLLASIVFCLAFSACTTPQAATDAGGTDSSIASDAGTDTGTMLVDSGGPDSGRDASAVDSGPVPDAGPRDAGPTDQCTNPADMAIATMASTGSAVAMCGSMTFGREPELMNCIVAMTGLSAGCASCYDGQVHCVIMNCLGAGCAADPGGASCVACRMMNCQPAFASCSGLP